MVGVHETCFLKSHTLHHLSNQVDLRSTWLHCIVCVLHMWANVLLQHSHSSPVLACVSLLPSLIPFRLV